MAFRLRPPTVRACRWTVLCFAAFVTLVPLLTSACESTDVPDEPVAVDDSATVLVTDANNFSAVAMLNVPSLEVATAPGVNLTFDWSNLTQDLLCQPVAPTTDVNSLQLYRFEGLTTDEVAAQLASFQQDTNAVELNLNLTVAGQNRTSASLEEFVAGATPVIAADVYLESPNPATPYTYVLVFSRGMASGDGRAASVAFLKPTAGSDVDLVQPGSACDALTYVPTFGAPVSAPVAGPWIADWSAIDLDSKSLNPSKLTRLLIAHYAGQDISFLQDQHNFFNLESAATSLWKLELGSTTRTSADLTAAQLFDPANPSVPGAAFSGFTDPTGLWILAVMCDKCDNPAPVVLSVLNPI